MSVLESRKITYKQQKEAFVSGHMGQPVEGIIKIVSIVLVCILALQSWYFGKNYGFFHFLIEYGLYYMIPLLFSTFFSFNLGIMILGLLFSIPVLWFCAIFCKINKNSNNNAKKSLRDILKSIQDTKDSEMKSYISSLRGTIMLISCLAILGVDFKIFPRRHAKVETWGISLMDLGVGFFVFSSGVVAIKNIKNNYLNKISFIEKIKISLKQSYMFFVIGLIRILITKISGYPEHITEYGIHWNFFFTLGSLSLSLIFVEFLHQYLKSYIIIVALLSICNELLIRSPHVLAYVLNAPRTNLISANKEVFQMFIEILFFGSSAKYFDIVPLMLHCVSKNGLIVFLIANLMTGLVNSLINTLEVSNITGFLIMTVYGIILCGIAFIVDIKKWKLKF
ncbi:hypothetical protein PMAC_002741 [Pneumocystis sp. 'macacae']|nr:hypothetical protein PMAC_002741 [Pneumocystis sp. 'macacae']